MPMEEYLKELVNRFKEKLSGEREVLECFHKYGVQVEGWLKGEFLWLLHREKMAQNLENFDREVSWVGGGRRKIDFTVTKNEETAWIELKHFLIGEQQGTTYTARSYFRDTVNGIRPTAEKLRNIPDGEKFILILYTKKPEQGWENEVAIFNRFPPLHLESLTNAEEYPDFYFLSLLKCG
jgi:hypothetical protein